jgi:hypothetical protein
MGLAAVLPGKKGMAGHPLQEMLTMMAGGFKPGGWGGAPDGTEDRPQVEDGAGPDGSGRLKLHDFTWHER